LHKLQLGILGHGVYLSEECVNVSTFLNEVGVSYAYVILAQALDAKIAFVGIFSSRNILFVPIE